MGSHNNYFDAKQVQKDFWNDFCSALAGSVPWQRNMVNSTTNPFGMYKFMYYPKTFPFMQELQISY